MTPILSFYINSVFVFCYYSLMQKSLTSTLRYALMSYKKLNLVAKMVRWKSVHDAELFLSFLPKSAWRILRKALHSAASNAQNNLQLNRSDLFIQAIEVGRGPKLKRVRAVWRWRMHKYEKHRSFLRICLAVK